MDETVTVLGSVCPDPPEDDDPNGGEVVPIAANDNGEPLQEAA